MLIMFSSCDQRKITFYTHSDGLKSSTPTEPGQMTDFGKKIWYNFMTF